jgi:hypothetical protein
MRINIDGKIYALRIGTKVRVKRPQNLREEPVWVPAMDDKKPLLIQSLRSSHFRDGNWSYNYKWIVKVYDDPIMEILQ